MSASENKAGATSHVEHNDASRTSRVNTNMLRSNSHLNTARYYQLNHRIEPDISQNLPAVITSELHLHIRLPTYSVYERVVLLVMWARSDGWRVKGVAVESSLAPYLSQSVRVTYKNQQTVLEKCIGRSLTKDSGGCSGDQTKGSRDHT
ncbi:hypothetical protein Tco_1283022 [Tanacetum coccineum]